MADKKDKKDEKKPEDVPLGSGLAEQAKNVLKDRNKRIQEQLDAAMGKPKKKKKDE